jgi:metal-responsive CopG/Arc/MetJ family transcriptional regulator
MNSPVLSARVDEEVAEAVEELAERTDSTRTEAIRRVVRAGLELEEMRKEQDVESLYTVELDPVTGEAAERVAENAGYSLDEFVAMVVRQKVEVDGS